MADSNKSGKADRNRNKAIAGRLKHLRSDRFETVGFDFHDKPTLAEARKLYGENMRRINELRPTPSVPQG